MICSRLKNKRCKNVKAAGQRCSVKKVFLEISQNSQKNNCARVSFLIKLQAEAWNFIKKRLAHRCFPVNFAKFLTTPFHKEPLRWLLPKMSKRSVVLQADSFIYNFR